MTTPDIHLFKDDDPSEVGSALPVFEVRMTAANLDNTAEWFTKLRDMCSGPHDVDHRFHVDVVHPGEVPATGTR